MPLLLLLGLGVAGGLVWWRRRGDTPRTQSAECDARDAELDAIGERQYQVVANLAAATDHASRDAWAEELVALETRYNELAAGMPALGCDSWAIRSAE